MRRFPLIINCLCCSIPWVYREGGSLEPPELQRKGEALKSTWVSAAAPDSPPPTLVSYISCVWAQTLPFAPKSHAVTVVWHQDKVLYPGDWDLIEAHDQLLGKTPPQTPPRGMQGAEPHKVFSPKGHTFSSKGHFRASLWGAGTEEWPRRVSSGGRALADARARYAQPLPATDGCKRHVHPSDPIGQGALC